MIRISREKAVDLIKNSRGKIFTAEFIKRGNGERRKLNTRLGVSQYGSGGGFKYNAEERDLINGLLDLMLAKKLPKDKRKQAYRQISIEGLRNLSINGEKYTIDKGD